MDIALGILGGVFLLWGTYLFVLPLVGRVLSKPLSFTEEGLAKCPNCGEPTVVLADPLIGSADCKLLCESCGLFRRFTHKEWMSLI